MAGKKGVSRPDMLGNQYGVSHGMYKSPTYTSWRSMIYRCSRTEGKYYHDYVARGITVCKEWRKFENFLADMGERPPGTTRSTGSTTTVRTSRLTAAGRPGPSSRRTSVRPSVGKSASGATCSPK